MQIHTAAKDYTIPEGCPVCSADLNVRVSDSGPIGVCLKCLATVRPNLRVTASGLEVEFRAAAA
jgi:hypothetical protein